ncbi:sigma factor-like helix-turn-helix DNA-binding protein [Streptomyces sp. Ag109_O5-10]|uniref:sigma factor-like helix-turn-helix DNA-binding protein n=1 Tax=Streptomyces sp. Ag109_O5-10 TaxID=1855349 RepID=UPI000897B1AC|nr:sigma factor-like helix-turn-helix DNA-binding protein [Streptomyces sp. Ag109_O5-10]SEF16898.1 RNA polymerase sigma-70 factor, ECF subfamily [Streptomyces sp. Ag109_O5-10]
MDDADAVPVAELLDERRHLLEVTYWMLGDSREAENVVGESYRRWYGLSDAERGRITAPRHWLTKTAGGICLGLLARPRRGVTGRPDRPAEHSTAPPDSGGAQAGLAEEVSRVLLNALDSLSPAERAAFVLNDVFGMASRTVADIVGRPEPECTELADRARRSLRMQRSRSTPPDEQDLLARTVRQACVDEDAELLESLLCPDATAFFDGGGKVRALSRPVHGSRQVAHSLLTLLARHPRTALTTHSVNGRTGLVVRYDCQVAAVISLDIAEHRVAQAWVVLNPDKLRSWNQPPAIPDSGSHGGPSSQGDDSL